MIYVPKFVFSLYFEIDGRDMPCVNKILYGTVDKCEGEASVV